MVTGRVLHSWLASCLRSRLIVWHVVPESLLTCFSYSTHSLTDKHAGTPMGITAENLAEKYGISREVSM